MYYSAIKNVDVANGPGIRTSLYVSGCTHHCKGCFNEDTWNFKNGQEFTDETLDDLIKAIKTTNAFSLLGGEPFDNIDGCLKVLKTIRAHYPNIIIWCWTGYLFENIKKDDDKLQMLSLIDVLVDGKFNIDLKDLRLKFKGSSNQRVIDVSTSLLKDKVVIIEKYNN